MTAEPRIAPAPGPALAQDHRLFPARPEGGSGGSGRAWELTRGALHRALGGLKRDPLPRPPPASVSPWEIRRGRGRFRLLAQPEVDVPGASLCLSSPDIPAAGAGCERGVRRRGQRIRGAEARLDLTVWPVGNLHPPRLFPPTPENPPLLFLRLLPSSLVLSCPCVSVPSPSRLNSFLNLHLCAPYPQVARGAAARL